MKKSVTQSIVDYLIDNFDEFDDRVFMEDHSGQYPDGSTTSTVNELTRPFAIVGDDGDSLEQLTIGYPSGYYLHKFGIKIEVYCENISPSDPYQVDVLPAKIAEALISEDVEIKRSDTSASLGFYGPTRDPVNIDYLRDENDAVIAFAKIINFILPIERERGATFINQ